MSAASQKRPFSTLTRGIASWWTLVEALLVCIAILLLAVWGLGRFQLRRSFPAERGEIALPGLGEPVSVVRDARGIPHIYAESTGDAFFALGFIHAQDRLGQMLWLRAAALGQASAWIGAEGLGLDREARLVGIAQLAQRDVAILDASTMAVLDAYSRGVNARLARIRSGEAHLPFSAKALDPVEIAPWRPVDCLALVKLYAFGLDGSIESSLVYERLIERLGGFGAAPFLPDSLGEGEDASRTDEREARARLPRGGGLTSDFGALRRAIGLRGKGVGSTAWVVSGEETTSGYPLLAADMHLQPTVPSLVVQTEVATKDFDIAGVSIPGIPLFWSGRNRYLAWASVGLGAVTLDLFVETLSADGKRFFDRRGWSPLTTRRERIEVKDGDAVEFVVRETSRGPLLAPALAADREPLSLAWVGAQPGDDFAALLGAMRAKNVASFREKLAQHRNPPLAFVFADIAGNTGLQVAGVLPQRVAPARRVPVPSRARRYRWQGMIPFSELPARTGAGANGVLVAADRPLSTWKAFGKIEWRARTGARAARIETLLRGQRASGLFDLRTMSKIQGDVHSLPATALLRRVFALVGTEPALVGGARKSTADGRGQGIAEGLSDSLRILRTWDGDLGHESAGATTYHVFVDALFRDLFAESLGPELYRAYLALPETDPEHVLLEVLGRSRSELSETWAQLSVQRDSILRSLEKTGRRLAALSSKGKSGEWGRFHTLRFSPLFGAAPRRWALSRSFPCGGDAHTVLAASFDAANPYRVRVAPLYRWVVDLGDLAHARMQLAPGQSEHPGHPHFADGAFSWQATRYQPFAMTDFISPIADKHLLRLIPAP